MTVLVVDPSFTLRRQVRSFLEDAGLGPGDIVEADDGPGALTVLCTTAVGLLVVGWNLPRLSGPALISHLRGLETYQALAVVAVAPDGRRELKVEALKLGVSALVTEPLDRRAFLEAVHPFLRS